MIVLAPDFMTTICKKAAQNFHRTVSKVFDRVKSVALWSANIRKLTKDHKGYGSAATLDTPWAPFARNCNHTNPSICAQDFIWF